MYEVAMSSRVEEKHDVREGHTGEAFGVETTARLDDLIYEEDSGLGGIQTLMKFTIICFLVLLGFGSYKVVMVYNEKHPSSEQISFDQLSAWDGTPITSTEINNFQVPVKREFVSSPGIDPTITASIKPNARVEKGLDILIREVLTSGETYTVMPGDTLGEIAIANGIKLGTLIEINAISDPKHITPGMKLALSQQSE